MNVRTWLMCAAFVVVAGCSKCGSKAASASQVERMLPRGATAVLVVPSVKTLGERLTILEGLKVAGFVGQLQGFDTPKAFSDALVGQLGVDVRSAEAMAAAGIDANRGLGAVTLPSSQVVLVLPVSDETKFHATIERISAQRFGAGAGAEVKGDNVTVKTFAMQQGQPAKLGYVLKSGFALIATTRGVTELAALANLPEADSMASDEVLKQSLARLPNERLFFAYVPPVSKLLKDVPVTSAVATVRLSATGLAIAVDAPWKGDLAQLEMLKNQPSTSLFGYLPKDAVVTIRYQGDPASLAPVSKQLLGSYLSKALDEASFDVKSEILDQLKPGAVMALSLADKPPMDKGMPTLNLRTTNPFSYAHLSGAVLVNSGDKVIPTLEKIASVAPKFAAAMSKVDRNGTPMFFTTYAAGEGVHFAPRGDLLFFGSPVQRIDALEAVNPTEAAAVPVPGTLANDAVAVVVDLTKLATAVRELPSSAWGLGGFAIKATTVRWLDATDDLKAVTASFGVKDHSLQLNVALVLGTKTP